MKRVFSSHISEVGYDAESETLTVAWQNGSTTVYAGVPVDVGLSVENAPSVGQALHDRVRGKYQHQTVKK